MFKAHFYYIFNVLFVCCAHMSVAVDHSCLIQADNTQQT